MSALTVGVEEEFLLLDPGSGENLPVAPDVLAALDDHMRSLSRVEFRPSMLEMVTPVCTGLDQVDACLRGTRRAASAAAARAGAVLTAVGATPVAEPLPADPDDERFRAIVRHYGPIARDPAVCGCHVHVGMPDRDTAVEVGNRLRPWLPVVQAVAVNSPLHAGADTGYAGWRSVQLDRWPGLGPAPWFASGADLDATVAALVAAGTMLDETMVLWHARPSARYPTIEVRVTDVCATVDDAVLVTALVRALAGTALDDLAVGRPGPVPPEHLLRAAHGNAARSGLDGTLLDLATGRARPAWAVVDDLLTTVDAALRRAGDLDRVTAELERVRKEGTGADRQRQVLRRAGDIPAVLSYLGAQTVAG